MTRESFHDDAKAKLRPMMIAESACHQISIDITAIYINCLDVGMKMKRAAYLQLQAHGGARQRGHLERPGGQCTRELACMRIQRQKQQKYCGQCFDLENEPDHRRMKYLGA